MKKSAKQEVIDRLKGKPALESMDWKQLYELCLELLEQHNNKLTLQELKAEYHGYFEEDYIKSFKYKTEFLQECMRAEEEYKGDYTEQELIEVIKCMGY